MIGTPGAIRKSLKKHLAEFGPTKDMNDIIRSMQLTVLRGTVKTVKTVLRMKKCMTLQNF